MQQIKYTSDNRKVVVLSKLNNSQSIVQEIFVTESGDEIPSGENFVVDKLHEQPVKSWSTYYQKKCEDAENQYKKLLEQKEQTISQARKQLGFLKKGLEELSQFKPDDIAQFLVQSAKYLDPENKIIAYDHYNGYEIEDFISNRIWSDYYLKMILYPSGSGHAEIYISSTDHNPKEFQLFKTKQEAVAWVEKRIEEKGITYVSDRTIQMAEKHGYKIPQNLIDDFINKKIESIELKLNQYLEDAEKAKIEINKLKSSQNEK